MFNAIKYTKRLEEAGFSREQAETQLQVISEIVEDDLVTKQDLKILETNILNAINGLSMKIQDHDARFTSLDHKFQTFDSRLHSVELKMSQTDSRMDGLENKIDALEYRLTIKLGTLFVLGFTAFASLMKFWLH